MDAFLGLLSLVLITGATVAMFWSCTLRALSTAKKHQPARPYETYLPIRGRWLNYVFATVTFAVGAFFFLVFFHAATGALVLFLGPWSPWR